MGDLYLCSRTDILRNLYLDTGRNVAVVGAPEEFLDWIDKILPLCSEKKQDPASLIEGPFDVIFYWVQGGAFHTEDINSLMGSLTEDGDLWISVPIDRFESIYNELDMEKPMFYDQLRLMLNPNRMIIPLFIGSDRS